MELAHHVVNRTVPPDTLAISFHPGTAGSSLQRASAAGEILFNSADLDYNFCNHFEQRMDEAAALLTQEEQRWLRENLPGLIEEIDGFIEEYPEIAAIYHDA